MQEGSSLTRASYGGLEKATKVPLPADWLTTLSAVPGFQQLVGIMLTGSYARGDATPYSDVDLLCFVPALPESEAERYTLLRWGNVVVSVSMTTVEAKRAELYRPETAILAVPGLRQARILLDYNGSLARLQKEALAFDWTTVQPAADEYVSYMLMGYAEEVRKILSGLARRDEATALYGIWGLVPGLAQVVVVSHGLLLPTENAYFQAAQEAMGHEAPWTHYFRIAAGFDQISNSFNPVETRAWAALALYRETVALLRPRLRRDHLEVIELTLASIGER